jgi:hypothetical protein
VISGCRSRRPAAQPHSRPAVLRRQKGRRHTIDYFHARPETSPVQRRVRPDAGRPAPARPRLGDGPGREGTWATTLTPARPTHSPTPTLRTSHFPDPPPASLESWPTRCLDLKGCHERTFLPDTRHVGDKTLRNWEQAAPAWHHAQPHQVSHAPKPRFPTWRRTVTVPARRTGGDSCISSAVEDSVPRRLPDRLR